MEGSGEDKKQREIVNRYDRGEISQGKAAELAGLSRADFLDLLNRFQVSVIQYSDETLERELRNACPPCSNPDEPCCRSLWDSQ
jgi:predicted HTH domain antitoxin